MFNSIESKIIHPGFLKYQGQYRHRMIFEEYGPEQIRKPTKLQLDW
jgi:hypothetical protein